MGTNNNSIFIQKNKLTMEYFVYVLIFIVSVKETKLPMIDNADTVEVTRVLEKRNGVDTDTEEDDYEDLKRAWDKRETLVLVGAVCGKA